MELTEAKAKFLHTWGTMGTDWGVNRSMAQVHALLLVSPTSKSADEIMEELQISRGNANINLRSLIAWGLIYKEIRPGDRREYFHAEKEIWKVVTQIIIHRKKRELEPIIKVLSEVSEIEGEGAEVEEFTRMVKEIRMFAQKTDKALDSLTKANQNWILGTFLKSIY
jgi:DNA-binding transcriptional regulator GbsR (MarR family)